MIMMSDFRRINGNCRPVLRVLLSRAVQTPTQPKISQILYTFNAAEISLQWFEITIGSWHSEKIYICYDLVMLRLIMEKPLIFMRGFIMFFIVSIKFDA